MIPFRQIFSGKDSSAYLYFLPFFPLPQCLLSPVFPPDGVFYFERALIRAFCHHRFARYLFPSQMRRQFKAKLYFFPFDELAKMGRRAPSRTVFLFSFLHSFRCLFFISSYGASRPHGRRA